MYLSSVACLHSWPKRQNQLKRNNIPNQNHRFDNRIIFTALHCMQRGPSDRNGVRLSVRPSVRPSVTA